VKGIKVLINAKTVQALFQISGKAAVLALDPEA
jgi:hypothetical protein